MPSFFAIRHDPSPGHSLLLKALSFLLPLGLWCLVSYVPGVWQPIVRVADPGESFFQSGVPVPRTDFEAANARLKAEGRQQMTGVGENPVYLPPPHKVAQAFYSAFTTPPLRKEDPWLHESLLHSLRIIMIGFGLSAIVGVPIGILCGTFGSVSRLVEPVVDFVRYMPPPVFGALAVAVLGLYDPAKLAIIFIGTVFCMIRVIANTTRQLDTALLEAAMTLGASRKRLLTGVIVPGILPNLYNDLRILLGAAWTLLTIAELIGALSGISYFIDRQGKYFKYDNVFAGIVMIGMLGLITDKLLTMIGAKLFPWQAKPAVGMWSEIWLLLRGFVPHRRGFEGSVPAGAGASIPEAMTVPTIADLAASLESAADPKPEDPEKPTRRADAATA
ncbi:ABC transporter permease [Humisphaera borealis]|uniref:ABC transporter permease subunit n=1 Tax=Humisphaera borealis TaxID=2807512 RepID=A0A7M2WZD9_9BACT|nr:ABC transporter permease [Humisphaera borealis]QOV90835.1 ABC transporter permease subunit [Humisphaera borealis]